MGTAIRVKKRDVAAILKATFPEYSGRKITVIPTERVFFYGLNWDSGSRSQYRAATLGGEATGEMDGYNALAPWNNPAEGGSAAIPEGMCVVEHTIFCGKDAGLRIHVNPADMPKWITDESGRIH